MDVNAFRASFLENIYFGENSGEWKSCELKKIIKINEKNILNDETEVGFIPMANISDKYSNHFEQEVKRWGDVKKGLTHVMDGNILLAKITPSFQNRKSVIVEKLKNGVGAATTEVYAIKPDEEVLNTDYLFWFFHTERFIRDGISAFTGSVGQQRIPKSFLQKYVIPLPNLNVQRDIVKKIEIVFEFAGLVEERQQLDKQLKKDLNEVLIRYAISGKLVPQQTTTEGSGADLLKEIYEDSIKENKKLDNNFIKRNDNKYYEYYEDGGFSEIAVPYKIPDSWCWVKLGQVIKLKSGRDLNSSEYSDNLNVQDGIPYITGASNFNQGTIVTKRQTASPISVSQKGDLLITVKGTIGEMAINPFNEAHIARQVMAISSEYINLEYLKILLNAFMKDLVGQATSLIPGISREVLLNTYIPLPPRKEQKRIVDKVNELKNLI